MRAISAFEEMVSLRLLRLAKGVVEVDVLRLKTSGRKSNESPSLR